MKYYCQLVILYNLLILIMSTTTTAQIKIGYKYLKKGNYNLAIQAFEKDVFNNKTNIAIEAEYNLSLIYFDKKYDGHNLDEAYKYIKSTLKRFSNLKINETKDLQKKKLGKSKIETLKRQITDAAKKELKTKNTYEAYENFFQNFDGTTDVQAEKLMIIRNELGLIHAIESGNWNSIESFFKKHHENAVKVSPDLDSLTQFLMFETFMNEKGWNLNNFNYFSENYPNNLYVLDSIPSRLYLKIAASKNIEDFKNFINAYPKSYYTRLSIKNIHKLTLSEDDPEDHDAYVRSNSDYLNLFYFVKNYSKYTGVLKDDYPDIRKIWENYIKIYGNPDEFYKNYPNCPIKRN